MAEAGRIKNWLFGRDGALLRAAVLGRVDLVQRLHADGANTMCSSMSGFTPLHRAAERGHRDVVEFLIQHGADPVAEADDGSTPVSLAEKNGHHDIAALLGHPA
jgi:ankyrin repeat protein